MKQVLILLFYFAAKISAHHCAPIAYAVTPQENALGYEKLLETIAKVDGCEDLVNNKKSMIWADLHTGIEKVAKKPCLNNKPLMAKCNEHIKGRLLKTYPKCSNLFHLLSNAKNDAEFSYAKNKLESTCSGAYKMLFEK